MAEIKVLHTSNLHLGHRFPNFDKETESLRASDIDLVFQDLAAYVIKKKIGLLLIAGDLFDRTSPGRDVISRTLSTFGEIHRKLPDARIVITPGREELFVRKDGRMDCNLTLFDHLSYVKVVGAGAKPESILYEVGGAPVRIASCRADFLLDKTSSIRSVPRPKEGETGIFLLSSYQRRGSVVEIGDDLLRDRVLEPLRKRGYKYVALGGRQRVNLIEIGDFTAVYSGGLERFDFETDRGRKCFITFSIKNNELHNLETIRTRARKMEYLNLTCSGSTTAAELEESLAGMGVKRSGKKILIIVLNGQLSFEQFDAFRNGDKISGLRKRFSAVHIENRLYLIDSSLDYNFDALKVDSPMEEFRRTVGREIEDARERGEEVRLLQELLEMGLDEIERGPE